MTRYGGRTKGTPNRKTEEAEAIARKLGCNPIEILCRFAMDDWKKLGYNEQSSKFLTQKGELIEKPLITPEIRMKAASELAQYLYPKRKAIEHSGEISAVTEQRLTTTEIQNILVDDPFLKAKEFATTATPIKEEADGIDARPREDSEPRDGSEDTARSVPEA